MILRARRPGFGFIDTRSAGAALWEFTHPGQVQAEYEAVGKTPPSYGEIWEGAAQDVTTAARESFSNAGEAALVAVDLAKFAAIAAGIVLVLYLLDKRRK